MNEELLDLIEALDRAIEAFAEHVCAGEWDCAERWAQAAFHLTSKEPA